ncbi:hypothetical protein POM88_041928 [Heracleum sosnowskyi]|uniref:Uncharacterized protein n=1 Tax=Heracleum sosnowskyi TaxID=360622 RepID=A0AAD8HFC1_9APIA|nr:hypothetical protein POM88_041928 [Heracleum sosnowskyi]
MWMSISKQILYSPSMFWSVITGLYVLVSHHRTNELDVSAAFPVIQGFNQGNCSWTTSCYCKVQITRICSDFPFKSLVLRYLFEGGNHQMMFDVSQYPKTKSLIASLFDQRDMYIYHI